MLVKICGTTSVEDALLAQDSGADFLGVILCHPPSPRNIELERARAIRRAVEIPVVAVTVNQPFEQLLEIHDLLAPYALQLHGDEEPELVAELVQREIRVWAAVSGEGGRQRASTLYAAGAEAVLIDARSATKSGETVYGGTGKRSDWNLAKTLADEGRQVILSGGLAPDNIREAIETVQPWLVDAVSGVELRPGVKSPEKLQQFIKNAKVS